VVAQLLALLDQIPRGLAQRHGLTLHEGRQHPAPVEMRADHLGQIPAALRAAIRSAAERLRHEVAQVEAVATRQTASDHVIHAIGEHDRALFGRQDPRATAIEVERAPFVKDERIAGRDHPRAPRARHSR
jgi:hypothetical protein